MEIKGTAKLLRVIVGESDKVKHTPLYEVIVGEARKRHLAGATAWRGVLGFGRTARMRTSKLLDLSSDMPMVIEIVDTQERINSILPFLDEHVKEGLITMETVRVIRYHHEEK